MGSMRPGNPISAMGRGRKLSTVASCCQKRAASPAPAIAVHHWILAIILSSSWEGHFQAGHPDNEEGDEAQAQQQYHEDCGRLAARA